MKNTQIINKNSKYIVSAAEMKRCDGMTITHFGVPQDVLMERAALSLCEEVKQKAPEFGRVLIFAGSGNNGGDGIAASRLLSQEGFEVRLILVNHKDKRLSEACERQIIIAQNYRVNMTNFSEIEIGFRADYFDVIIDSMLGIGCSRDLSGEYEQATNMINEVIKNHKRRPFIIAADIPTGINADSGQICKTCVHADMTVTFGFIKLGLMLYPGSSFCGDVLLREVGITEDGFLLDFPRFRYIESMSPDRIIKSLLPERNPAGNKGTFGKVLVAAGSKECSGAMIMAAESVLRSGAGMVKVFTEKSNLPALQTILPEAMSDVYDEDSLTENYEELENKIIRDISWCDSIVLGPGIGTGKCGRMLVESVLKNGDKVIVLDADALNIIAEDKELRELAINYSGPKIMTPHLAEFGRLFGKSPAECKEMLLDFPGILAKEFYASIICKDARTVITDGDNNYLNISGNDGMATAGSGDVLSGLVGALLCLPFSSTFEVAVTACYIHGLAGDIARHKHGSRGMTARDISMELQEIFTFE